MSSGRGRWLRRLVAIVTVLLLPLAFVRSPVSAEPTLPDPPPALDIGARADAAVVSWSSAPAPGWVVEVGESVPFLSPRRVLTTDSVAVLAGLAPQPTYYVRVRPRAVDGTVGSASPVSRFTTAAQRFPAATPAVDVEPATTTSLSVTWPTVDLAASYQVEFSANPDLSDARTLTTDEPKAALRKLRRGTGYHVRVRALDATGQAVTAWSRVVSASTPEKLPLRVATYNVLCENCSKGKASWAKRRGAVVAAIRDQDPDVIGLQEASQGRIPGGGTQYQDIVRRLGAPYRITDSRRGASLAVRIVYNADRVELVRKGSAFLPKGKSKRAATWAIFEQKATGERFFFLSTHLEPSNDKKGSRKYYNVRRRQANAVVDIIRRNNPDGLPVIAVGDFNSTKWDKPTNAPYDIMEAAGYADPLGNGYRTRGTAPGAFVENRIRTSYASYNMYRRKARNFPGHVNGSNPDYIFVSPMRVSEYETVVNVNSAGRWVGVIPSDHNMLRATVWLP